MRVLKSLSLLLKIGIRMFFRKKKEPLRSAEQQAQIAYAQSRIRQKKRLYNH